VRRRRSSLRAAEDVDPIAFVPNLFDAILVLTVALLVSLSAAQAKAARAVPDGQRLEGFVDTGVERAGQGERLGVAYRLADGRLIYVPEGARPPGGERR
jgi:hypothetical protein